MKEERRGRCRRGTLQTYRSAGRASNHRSDERDLLAQNPSRKRTSGPKSRRELAWGPWSRARTIRIHSRCQWTPQDQSKARWSWGSNVKRRRDYLIRELPEQACLLPPSLIHASHHTLNVFIVRFLAPLSTHPFQPPQTNQSKWLAASLVARPLAPSPALRGKRFALPQSLLTFAPHLTRFSDPKQRVFSLWIIRITFWLLSQPFFQGWSRLPRRSCPPSPPQGQLRPACRCWWVKSHLSIQTHQNL